MTPYAFLFAACALIVNALVGEDGLVDSLAAGQEHRRLVDDVNRLRVENEQLRNRARRLREDPSAVEEVARGELGLIKPGEILFLINDDPPQAR